MKLGARIVQQLLEAEQRSRANQAKPAIISVAEFVRGFGTAPDPLVEDADGGEIIGRGQQGALYGLAGGGKTAVLNELFLAVSSGAGMGFQHLQTQPLFRSVKGRVLAAIYEDAVDYRRRILALAKARGLDLDTLDWGIVSTDLNITKDRDRALLLQRIRDDAATNDRPRCSVLIPWRLRPARKV
jgi:AAA domain